MEWVKELVHRDKESIHIEMLLLCYVDVLVEADLRGKCQSNLFKQSKRASHQSWPMPFALLAWCVIF